MDIYKKAYFFLFNAITDAQKLLLQGQTSEAMETLMQVQLDAEEMIISAEE